MTSLCRFSARPPVSLLVSTLILCAGWATAAVGSSALTRPGPPAPSIEVVDAAGDPVDGVAVLMQPNPLALHPKYLSETTITATGPTGRFEPPPREAGDALVVLRKAGYESPAFEAARYLPAKIVLGQGAVIEGQILTSDGKPLAGAVVAPTKTTTAKGGKTLPRLAAITGSDGKFRFNDLTSAPCAVQVYAPGYTARLTTMMPGEPLKLALSTGGAEVTGTLVGSKTRQPAPGAVVTATGSGIELFAETDTAGNFALSNIPAGTWVFRPAGGGPASGTISRPETVDVAADTKTSISLVLNQGIRLAGSVIDAATSQPLPGVPLALSGYAGAQGHGASTEADGSFNFTDLDSLQDLIIRFDPVSFVYVMPDGALRDYFRLPLEAEDLDLTTITIPLHRRLPIMGQVINADGTPGEGAEILLEAEQDILVPIEKQSVKSLRTLRVPAGPGGRFRGGVYPPGRYSVHAMSGKMLSQPQQVDVFTTAPAPNLTLKLEQAGRLSGIALDAQDKPVTSALVVAWRAANPEPPEKVYDGSDLYKIARTGPDGSFSIEGLQREDMKLRAHHQDFVSTASMTITPSQFNGTTDQLKLRFPSGNDLRLLIHDSNGKPVSQALIEAEYMTNLDGHQIAVRSDSYGHARVMGLPVPQVASMVISHPSYAPQRYSQPFALAPGERTVVLQKRPNIIVEVSRPGGSQGNVEVYLMRADVAPEFATEPEASLFRQVKRGDVVGGKAAFLNAEPGWYKAAAVVAGSFAESKPVQVDAKAAEARLSLEIASGTLIGSVIDAQTGSGVAAATVNIVPRAAGEEVTGAATSNTTTDDKGAFQIEASVTGAVRVKVVASGYPEFEDEVDLVAGKPLDIKLSNAASTVKGKVSQASSPVDGALVVASKEGVNESPVATGMSDQAGAYTLTDIPAGRFLITVEAPIGDGDNISRKSKRVTTTGEEQTVDFDFPTPVRVTGSVRLNGKVPVRDKDSTVTLLFMPTEAGLEALTVPMAADGTFQTVAEPGNYTVGIEDQPGQPVSIPAGASHRLELKF